MEQGSNRKAEQEKQEQGGGGFKQGVKQLKCHVESYQCELF